MSRILMCAAAGALLITSPAIAQEKVSFPSTDADLKGGTPTTITGYLYKPVGSGPFGAIVGMHGCGGLKNVPAEALYEQWAEILPRAGYIVLLVDSLQPRRRGSLCGDFGVGLLREMPRDAVGGMNYLRSRPDVRPDSIAIIGWSYGGNATLFATSKSPLPYDLALPKAPERDFRAAIVFYPGCDFLLGRNPNQATNTHWQPRQPMLLLMGELDNVAPAPPCKDLVAQVKEEKGPSIDAHFYPNAYHIFDHPNFPKSVNDLGWILASNAEARADAINRVTQFLAKQLQ
jgi:dienelactone hydrolase